jgi:hypothetical protein
LIPGPLYNEPTVPLASLLVPYPQYGPLLTIGNCCNLEHYNQLQLQVSKPFAHGSTFLFGYVYIREATQINNFNDLTYYNNQFQWQDSNQLRQPCGQASLGGRPGPSCAVMALICWVAEKLTEYVALSPSLVILSGSEESRDLESQAKRGILPRLRLLGMTAFDFYQLKER